MNSMNRLDWYAFTGKVVISPSLLGGCVFVERTKMSDLTILRLPWVGLCSPL